MHYLTVPDLVWLNLQLTGTPQKYNYATLEEGVFYQYAYGTSTDVFGQAARLLGGFAKLAPFASGNRATALAATAGFLAVNGQELDISDAENLFNGGAAALEAASHAHDVHLRYGVPNSREALRHVMESHSGLLAEMVKQEPVAELV
ncbi:MAG: hypothetical protein KF857_11210 [Fimbriimonadaceae bacterium]|nr:hypothetical protein [Fimbriimonadaceae bacterium]